MVNVFDQAQAASPSAPAAAGPAWFHPERVWGYAGFWWRTLAWTIDSLILSVVTLLIDRTAGGRIGGGGVGPASTGNLLNVAYTADPAAPGDSLMVVHGVHFPTLGWPELVGLLLPIAYFTLLESSRWQATLGKRICRLKVTGLDGQRITPLRALGRYLAKFLSAFILCIGFLMIGWTRRKQGLHDLVATTLVVRLRPPNDLVRFNPPA